MGKKYIETANYTVLVAWNNYKKTYSIIMHDGHLYLGVVPVYVN